MRDLMPSEPSRPILPLDEHEDSSVPMVWEAIGPKHKTGIAILAVHKDYPHRPYVVEWWGGKLAWADPDGDKFYGEHELTHACLTPVFSSRPA